jgi:hypothetical protein
MQPSGSHLLALRWPCQHCQKGIKRGSVTRKIAYFFLWEAFPVFHWRHDARPRYLHATMQTIQVRPSREPRWQKQGGWQVYEGDGVSPVYCGPSLREKYTRARVERAGLFCHTSPLAVADSFVYLNITDAVRVDTPS